MLDIAIVEGVRTPFAKAFGALASVPAQQLGRLATTAPLDRAGVRPDHVDQVDFGITRDEQDRYALESHRRAADAQKRGVLGEEIVPVPADLAGRQVQEDVGPRKDQTPEALARPKPIFEKDGTVTVGNSCMVTD